MQQIQVIFLVVYGNKFKGQFLLSSGNGYTAGTTGGEATHTITISEMPMHSHAAVNGDSSFHFMQFKVQDGLSGKIVLRGADGSATRTLYGVEQPNQWNMLRDDDTTAATGGSRA